MKKRERMRILNSKNTTVDSCFRRMMCGPWNSDFIQLPAPKNLLSVKQITSAVFCGSQSIQKSTFQRNWTRRIRRPTGRAQEF